MVDSGSRFREVMKTSNSLRISFRSSRGRFIKEHGAGAAEDIENCDDIIRGTWTFDLPR